MAERLANTGADFEMHYCTRSPERTAFRAAHRGLGLRATGCTSTTTTATPAQKLDLAGAAGRSRQPARTSTSAAPRASWTRCWARRARQGWPEAQLHYEFFGADGGDSPTATRASRCKLASSGRIVVVPKDKTVTQALAEAGVEILMSCEQGVCGTCLTRVLEGVPDHRTVPHARGAGGQRPVPALLLALQNAACWCWTCKVAAKGPSSGPLLTMRHDLPRHAARRRAPKRLPAVRGAGPRAGQVPRRPQGRRQQDLRLLRRHRRCHGRPGDCLQAADCLLSPRTVPKTSWKS